jgi:hypothetical protein
MLKRKPSKTKRLNKNITANGNRRKRRLLNNKRKVIARHQAFMKLID